MLKESRPSGAMADIPIAVVWQMLGGDEIRHGRARAFHRGGDDPNVAFDFERNVFFDFVAGEGGGALQLVKRVLGCGTHSAFCWLEDQGFLERRRLGRAEWERQTRSRDV